MTRYAPLWQQAGSYPGGLDRQLLGTIWPAGGTMGALPTIVASSMNVSIAPGACVVPLQAGQGSALCVWDAAELVTIAAAPAGSNNRADIIICQVRDNAIDAGPNNDFIFTTVQGVPAAGFGALPPATPANAFVIGSIYVIGSSANLAGAFIADKRSGANPNQVTPFTPQLVVYSSGAALNYGSTGTARGAYRMLGPNLMLIEVDIAVAGTGPNGQQGPICLLPPPGWTFTSDNANLQAWLSVTGQLFSAGWGSTSFNVMCGLLNGVGGAPGPNNYALSLFSSISQGDSRIQRCQNTDGTATAAAGRPQPSDGIGWYRAGASIQLAGLVTVAKL